MHLSVSAAYADGQEDQFVNEIFLAGLKAVDPEDFLEEVLCESGRFVLERTGDAGDLLAEGDALRQLDGLDCRV